MSKDEFVKALSSEGLETGFSNDGIPTVFINDPNDIGNTNKIVKGVIKKLGYLESYGITVKSEKPS